MKLTSKISRIAICISVLAIILSLISAIGILSNIIHNRNQNRSYDLSKYISAVKIHNEKEFAAALSKYNDVDILAEGTLEAVDTVTYNGVPGVYSQIKVDNQTYNRHYSGSIISYSWDTTSTEFIHSKEIRFLGQIYPYGTIPSQNRKITVLYILMWTDGFMEIQDMKYIPRQPTKKESCTQRLRTKKLSTQNFSQAILLLMTFWIALIKFIIYKKQPLHLNW